MIVMLNAIIMLLKAGLSGDDDDKGTFDPVLKVLANQIYRAESDIYFYISPATAWSILRDPVPLMATITDVGKAINGTYRYYSEDDYRGQAPYIKWGKTMPFFTQIPKTIYLSKFDVYNKKVLEQTLGIEE